MADPVPMNSEAARTTDGTLKDQVSTTTTEPASPPPTEKPPSADSSTTKPSSEPSTKPSLLNEGEKPPADKPVAPEAYKDFKAPEGFEFNKEKVAEASAIFKGLGLTQDQSQQLMDLYGKAMVESEKSALDLWSKTQTDWRKEVMDSDLGGQIDQVKATISKGLDVLGDPKLVAAFKQTMDLTGAGNNINFVRVFHNMAKLLTEGGAASASRPSAAGMPAGEQRPRSAAQAMYPNLPTGG